MAIKTGVVEQMHESGKRFKLDDGEWYSAFSSSQVPSTVGMGVTVSFNYATVEKDDRKYNNVKGNVKVITGAAAKEVVSDGAHPATAYKPSGGSSKGSFPIPALDGQRSIIRQNSLTQANALMSTWTSPIDHAVYSTAEGMAEKVIELARMFEAYSAGDLDAAEAAAAVEEMRASMVKADAHK